MPSPRRCDPSVPTAAYPRSVDPRASDAAAPPSPPPPVLTSSSELGDWVAASAASRGPTPPGTEGHRTPPASPQVGPSPSTSSGGEDPPTSDDHDDDDGDQIPDGPVELTVTKSTSTESVVRLPCGTVRTTKSGLLTRGTTVFFGQRRQSAAPQCVASSVTSHNAQQVPGPSTLATVTTLSVITMTTARALPDGQGWHRATRGSVSVVVTTQSAATQSSVNSSTTPLPTFSYITAPDGVPLAGSGVGVPFNPNRA